MTTPEGTRRAADVRGIIRVFPDLEDDLPLHLFHQGVKAQWTSRDLDWAAPLPMTGDQREALAGLLTPAYYGAQTAMLGASAILPQLMATGETTAQLYLTSFVVDQARHFEALARIYRKLQHPPLRPGRIPEMLRYRRRIQCSDPACWVWGNLVSDVVARHFYRSLGIVHSDSLLAGMTTRFEADTSRHLAFSEHYLRHHVGRMDDPQRQALIDVCDDLFTILQAMTVRVRADAVRFGVALDFMPRARAEVEASGRHIGL